MTKYLLGTLTADGSTSEISVPNQGQGYATVLVIGTFDGATINLDASPDNGTNFVPLDDSNLTAPGAKGLQLLSDPLNPIDIRMTAVGGGGSLDVTGYICFEDES